MQKPVTKLEIVKYASAATAALKPAARNTAIEASVMRSPFGPNAPRPTAFVDAMNAAVLVGAVVAVAGAIVAFTFLPGRSSATPSRAAESETRVSPELAQAA